MTASSNAHVAIDLSHHLNALSKSRVPSPLKDIIKYMSEPGMINFAGGLPHPSLFPFHNIESKIYAPGDTVLSDSALAQSISIPKYKSAGQFSNISDALQYTSGLGSPVLLKWLREFTDRVIKPGFENYEILMHCGNTDAWNKVVGLLCEPGDYILVEAYTYPSSQAVWAPMGCKGVAVPMDSQGMIIEELNDILVKWDTSHPGVKRPHVLYVVPVGQNPTGAVMHLERKKALYELCVKFDIIICEDDPYYFLQLPTYATSDKRQYSTTISERSQEDILSLLTPTLLSLDYEGRVIRLETFSKVLAPGLRLGYFICNPIFAERLLRATEVVTQAPSGFSQAIVLELLLNWKQDGFITWLGNISLQYTERRDWMCDILAEHFDISTNSESVDVTAFLKGTKIPVFSFAYPEAGMFLWLKLDLSQNPKFKVLESEGLNDPEAKWAEGFWMQMIQHKVLLTPGSYYVPFLGKDVLPPRQASVAYFRLAFSYETRDDMVEGLSRMASAFNKSWQGE